MPASLRHPARDGPADGTRVWDVFDLGPTVDLIWGIVGIVGSLAAVGALLWFAAKGHAERDEEDAAREFYDRHGHWPDEERLTAP